jgi:nucleotide-binding universal stress UspA family protein
MATIETPAATVAVSSRDASTTPTQPGRLIVAGIDGSECARHAARWAASEADQTGASLRLVYAYSLPAPSFADYYPTPDLVELLRDGGAASLDEVATELRSGHPALELSTHLEYGSPVTVLQEQSAGAYLTVVGAKGAGRITSVVLGSVALAISSTNIVPVAVIHDEPPIGHTGPVVIGVDGSPTSEAAVGFGLQWASDHSANVEAVHVSWYDTVTDTVFPALRLTIDPVQVVEQERELMSVQMEPWRKKYPALEIREVVTRGRAVPLLLEHSEKAQLLVVGSHGRGGFTGMLLGSTSHALITHSTCPVIVARHSD